MHILIAYMLSARVTDKCKFLLPEYAMFQKLAHANDRYFLLYFLEMIDELKRRGSGK